MSEMIERGLRAAKALRVPITVFDTDAVCTACRNRFAHADDCPRAGEKWPTIVMDRIGTPEEQFRAALLAALDLTHDPMAFSALVKALAAADDGDPNGVKYREQAKAALRALRDHMGQGGSDA